MIQLNSNYMKPFSAHSGTVPKDFINPYNSQRERVGKTRRDHANGAHARLRENRAARAEYTGWCSSSASQTASTATASAKFPLSRCNGRKSRNLKPNRGRVSKQQAK